MALHIFLFGMISGLQYSCQNITENSSKPFVQIYQVLTFSQWKTALKCCFGGLGKINSIQVLEVLSAHESESKQNLIKPVY